MQEPADLNRLVTDIRTQLEAAGLDNAAARLATVQETAFTTSSEWLGELGSAIRDIRKESKLSSDLDAKLTRIQKHVRRTWPSL